MCYTGRQRADQQQGITSGCHMLNALAPQRVHTLGGAGVHGVPQAQLARVPAAPGEELAAPGHQRSMLPPHGGLFGIGALKAKPASCSYPANSTALCQLMTYRH